jgi:hypothetical protein
VIQFERNEKVRQLQQGGAFLLNTNSSSCGLNSNSNNEKSNSSSSFNINNNANNRNNTTTIKSEEVSIVNTNDEKNAKISKQGFYLYVFIFF